jgi:hypothetical protein
MPAANLVRNPKRVSRVSNTKTPASATYITGRWKYGIVFSGTSVRKATA